MHFKGKELISRSTHVSHRSLITVTAITIISRHFKLDLTDITVFGLSLTESSIAPITLTIIILLLINYALNYWGDYVSFKEWNTNLEKESAYGTLVTNYQITKTHLKNFIENINEIIEDGKEIGPYNNSDSGDISDIKEQITNLEKVFKDSRKGFESFIAERSKLNSIAKIQLYIWYGLVTLVLTILAICLNYNPNLLI